MEKNQNFEIEKMAARLNMTPAEIKFLLNIPLDATCEAKTVEEAKEIYKNLEKNNQHHTEEGLAAFGKWVELFLLAFKKIDSIEEAEKTLKESPEEIGAYLTVFKKIADLHGVTKENHFKLKISQLKTKKEIIDYAFKFMPPGSSFISPSGKIELIRNSCPFHDSGDGMELNIKRIYPDINKLFVRFYWSAFNNAPKKDRIFYAELEREWDKEW
jgi:hypothetical protein